MPSTVNIYLKGENGDWNLLPMPTQERQPTICWDVPDEMLYTSYCLELKTQKETILSSGEKGFAYYSSGLVTSESPEHQLVYPLDLGTWEGAVEVRLRLFSSKGEVVFSTHGRSSEVYSFEPSPQGFSWNSSNDGCYLVVDRNLESISGTINPEFSWQNASDPDPGQPRSYQLQWAATPLFADGEAFKLGAADCHEDMVEESSYQRTSVKEEILSKHPVFYRVRTYDGMDYGEWSRINAFLYSPFTAPVCYFNFIETNCTHEDSNMVMRPSGEVQISFGVIDSDSPIVSAFLSYRLADEDEAIDVPLILSSSTVAVPTGEDIVVTWLSFRQLPDQRKTVYIRLYANDGSASSDVIEWEKVIEVNNLGISYGNGDIGGDDFSCRLSSVTRSLDVEVGIQIPDKKASWDGDKWIVKPLPTPPQGKSLKDPWDWNAYWSERAQYQSTKFTDLKVMSNRSYRCVQDLLSGEYEWIYNLQPYSFVPEEEYDLVHGGKIKRGLFALYDGWDDSGTRDAEDQLSLQYEDEFDEEGDSSFCEYLTENRQALAKWCKEQVPQVEFNENEIKLGKSIKDVQFFLRQPLYGRSIQLHRPNLVSAGNTGLYYDGMALENKSDDIFKSNKEGEQDGGGDSLYGDSGEEEAPLPEGVAELKKKELFKYFYQIDRMYDPNRSGGKGDTIDRTLVGPALDYRFDSSTGFYWNLFEYTLKITFPFTLSRENSRYLIEYNSKFTEGDLLDVLGSDMIVFQRSNSLTNEMSTVLRALFPQEIFSEITEESIRREDGTWIVNIHSLKIDLNRSFRFLKTDRSCYSLFKIDTNGRFSSKQQAEMSGAWATARQKEKPEDQIEFELQADSGKWIAKKGEENSGEPLFTCDRDHVDGNGFHYKYSEERFRLSGKVYIRKYFTRPAYATKSTEPLRAPMEGDQSIPTRDYAPFTLEYVGENEIGDKLFKKIESHNPIGGAPAVSKTILCDFEGRVVEDTGWWLPYTDLNDPDACVSHEWDEEEGVYTRKSPASFLKKIGFIMCYATEYVDIEEAWEKPLIDEDQGGHKLNRRQPVAHSGLLPTGYIQYIMGAYRPPIDPTKIVVSEEQASRGITAEDLAQKEEVDYKNDYSSVVYEATDGKLIGRYDENWKDAMTDAVMEKLRTVVDPFFIEAKCAEWYLKKYGIQPIDTLQTYFKIDESGAWDNRSIQGKNNIVHEIYASRGDEQAANEAFSQIYHGAIYHSKKLISDVNKIDVSKAEDEIVKRPYLDFRLTGRFFYDKKNYFSSLPVEESEAYKDRPIGPYGEDRPTRISGYIDEMSQILPWRIIYLQTSWNSYNLIHWEGTQDQFTYAKLEVAKIDNGRQSDWMTVYTSSSEWNDRFQAYLIPYEKLHQCDYIDTLNGHFLEIDREGNKTKFFFEDGCEYKFRLSKLNITSGTENEPYISAPFTYSKTAYSPPVVLGADYNPWNGQFTITFRLDDVSGRKYDVTGVSYCIYGIYDQSPPESSFIDIDMKNVLGSTEDLESNTSGDAVVSSAIIQHKLIIPNGMVPLSDAAGKLLRFRIDAVPSDERDGLTVPVFNFRMWTNELLKISDHTISLLAGNYNHWVLKEKYSEDGEYSQYWEYSREGVFVPGKIYDENKIISEVSSKFEAWYISSAVKFDLPGFEAKRSFLLTLNTKDDALFVEVAQGFFSMTRPADASHSDPWSYSSEWSAYVSANPGIGMRHLAENFIEDKGEEAEYDVYWDNFAPLKIGVNSSKFSQWWSSHSVLSVEECRILFVRQDKYSSDYNKFLTDNHLEDNDSSREAFILEKELSAEFSTFRENKNLYHDSRYAERKKFVEENLENEWEDWKISPENVYGEECEIYAQTTDSKVKSGKTYYRKSNGEYSIAEDVHVGDVIPQGSLYEMNYTEDDLLYLFMASDRARRDSFFPVNEPKSEAKSYFLSTSQNGISYGQQLQTAYDNLKIYQKQLNEAYRDRNVLETDHRRKLVMNGFFSNGWKNNEPYCGEEKNLVFRFRVENKPASGKVNKTPEAGIESGDSTVVPVAGYDTQWEVYYHWQMDLYDSFDSQNGRPFRDYLYMRADLLGYAGSDVETWMRIQAAIEADSGGMSVLPSQTYIPKNNTKIKSPTTDDPYSYQLAGRFAIPRTDLPGLGQLDPFTGKRTEDVLPEYWNKGEATPGDDWNQIFFWRVAPYNLVQRPLLEREQAEISSEISKIGENYYLLKIKNQIWGDHEQTKLPVDGYPYYYTDQKYIWVSTASLNTPAWTKDYLSPCKNSLDGSWTSYFHGTDEDFMDTPVEENSSYEGFISSMRDGRVVFLTDRPDEITDQDLLQPIDGDQFQSQWLPLDSKRESLWVYREEDGGGWYAVSHKTSFQDSNGDEHVIVLSKGLSPNCMGDVEQIMPTCSLDRVSTVIQDARSFEDPCLLSKTELKLYATGSLNGMNVLMKAEGASISSLSNLEIVNEMSTAGFLEVDSSPIDPSSLSCQNVTDIQIYKLFKKKTYWIYFSVKFDHGFQVYRTSSKDLLDWSTPSPVSFPDDARQIAVYLTSNGWKAYAVVGLSIREYSSSDGETFSSVRTILYEQYTPTRPSWLNGRVYYGLQTEWVGSGTFSKVYSIKDDGDMNSIRVEKGNAVNIQETTVPTQGDVFFTPMVMQDYDKGWPVKRIFYSSPASIYAYSSGSWAETEKKENKWFTEYEEEYSWSYVPLNPRWHEGHSTSTFSINGADVPILSDASGRKINLYEGSLYIPTGELTAVIRSESKPLAVKFPFYLDKGWKDAMSEGAWIWHENVGKTEAWLHPEDEDADFIESEHTLDKYILENNLYVDFLAWMSENYPGVSTPDDKHRTEFLLSTRQFSLYLKWSKKGPGMYRYLKAILNTPYWGSGD